MNGWLFPLGCLAAALGAVIGSRLRTRRTFRRLDDMLDRAIRGDFREEDFDEKLLSQVEARMAEYLSATAVSAGKIQAERDAVKALIADVSHQTKTPIANLRLYAQLLEERDLDPRSRALVSALEGQAERLETLVGDLVKASRLESGVIALRPRPGQVGPLLEAAAGQFGPAAAEKGLTLVLRSVEAEAVFDPRWTEEALGNLLDNAVKYTPAGGTVTLGATAYEFFCRIDVEDTGPGVPEEEQGKIFQRFYRSPQAGEEGTGIGLYLTRKIAEGQGGYVKLFSHPGKGAKFSLFLPTK